MEPELVLIELPGIGWVYLCLDTETTHAETEIDNMTESELVQWLCMMQKPAPVLC